MHKEKNIYFSYKYQFGTQHNALEITYRDESKASYCQRYEICPIVVTFTGTCHLTSLPRYNNRETQVLLNRQADLTDVTFSLTMRVQSWDEAEQECKKSGAELASLWSKDLIDAVKMLSIDAHRNLHSESYIVIGLKRKGVHNFILF